MPMQTDLVIPDTVGPGGSLASPRATSTESVIQRPDNSEVVMEQTLTGSSSRTYERPADPEVDSQLRSEEDVRKQEDRKRRSSRNNGGTGGPLAMPRQAQDTREYIFPLHITVTVSATYPGLREMACGSNLGARKEKRDSGMPQSIKSPSSPMKPRRRNVGMVVKTVTELGV
eukprot:758590-Hanusia_phi.AAC.1